ncbi:MAG: hypothetical protein KDA28_11750, partial [Phycisphaerales bacterium]|nr:hypothetical protein [Phycisphaerales bacterium]
MMTQVWRTGMAVGLLAFGAGAEVVTFDDIPGVGSRDSFRNLGIEQSYAGWAWLPTEELSWSEEGLWYAGNVADSQIGTVGAHSGDQVAFNGYGPLALSIEFDEPTFVNGAWFNVL